MSYPPIRLRCLLTFVSTLVSIAGADAEEPAAVMYEQVRPVFKKHCVSCHAQERSRGDLNLTTMEGIKAGSSSGEVAIAGKPDESLLYTLAAHLDAPKMPPGAPKIPQRELDLIRRWIEDGMLAKSEVTAATPDHKPAAVKPVGGFEAVTPLARPSPITALASSPSDSLIAVAGQRQVVLFAGSDRLPTRAVPFPEGEVFDLRFSHNGDLLLAAGGIGGESGRVVAIEVATGRRVFEVGTESDVALTVDLSPDRSLVALGGPGKSVKVYRTSDGELLHTLRKHTDWILSVAFSPDGLLLASTDRFGGMQVWEAGTGKPFLTLRGHVGSVNTVAWSADSDRLLTGGQDGTLRIWDMHQGTQLKSWDAGVGGVLSARWTIPNQIVAGGRDRKVAVFDPDGQRRREWSVADEVGEIVVSIDGSRLIAGDAAGYLTAWTIGTGTSSGDLVLPIVPAVARAAVNIPARIQRSRIETAPSSTGAANRVQRSAVNAASRHAENDLAGTREALSSVEAAVKSTEESLAKLKATAAKLKHIIATQEATEKSAPAREKRP